MKIIAIDPGPKHSAAIWWDTEKHEFWGERMLLDSNDVVGYILTEENDSWDLNMVAIEFPQSYGFSVGKDVLMTCFVVGQFDAVLSGKNVQLYGRPTIKGQIGGKTDAEIRASLRMRYGEAKKGEFLEGMKKDLWSAFALAVALEENPNLKQIQT